MIKFFRKIRYDLVRKNKTGKYFKYAIGEIVLVMIGILLALQVNNWRDKLNSTSQEVKILNQLRVDLDENKLRIQKLSEGIEISYNSIDFILKQFEKETKINDSLRIHFSRSRRVQRFDLASASYNYILNFGLNILSNDSLRLAISNIHEKNFIVMIKNQEELIRLKTELLDPFMLENFKPEMTTFTIKSNNSIGTAILPMRVPKDIDLLRQNEKYLNILYLIRQKMGINGDYTKQLLNNLEKLINRINEEIEDLDS